MLQSLWDAGENGVSSWRYPGQYGNVVDKLVNGGFAKYNISMSTLYITEQGIDYMQNRA